MRRTTIRFAFCLLSVILLMGYQMCQAQVSNQYVIHTVEKGQSLYSIAAMYGVAQSDIVSLNPGSDEKILAGQKLRIPTVKTVQDDSTAPKTTFHTIVSGETLYQLTVRYGVTAGAICDANPGLSARNFKAGQVIRIPAASVASTGTVPTETPKVTTDTDKTTAATNVSPSVKPRCREMHRVEKKETIFSITRHFGITEDELKAANPELKTSSLKKGMYLCIPYKSVPGANSTFTRSSQGASDSYTPSDNELFRQSARESHRYSTIRCAVILPFLSDIPVKDKQRAVEYYEGFLLAVDSLKTEGVNLDIYAYNSGTDANSVKTILEKPEMSTMNIIFGPFYQSQIQTLANFALTHNIRLVVPFSSKDNTVFANSAVYQINTPQSYLYSEVYDHFARQFNQVKVVFIEASKGAAEKAEFIKGFKQDLTQRGVVWKTIPETATAESYKAMLATDRSTVFVPTSGSNPTLIKILPQLKILVRDNPGSNVHLFGYPEWQTYTKDFLNTFFELDTYFYSSFYTNNLFLSSRNFTRKYNRTYGREMEDRYPKYGMLGFDTGYYFLKGLSRYGSNFEQELPSFSLPPVQTGFKFGRVNNWGGFINKKVYFIHLGQDFQVERLEFEN